MWQRHGIGFYAMMQVSMSNKTIDEQVHLVCLVHLLGLQTDNFRLFLC
jgi:hypothetical protein